MPVHRLDSALCSRRCERGLQSFSGTRAVIAAIVIAAVGLAASGSAQAESWAMLIGCEAYEKAPRLRYIVNDVNALEQALCQRGDFNRRHVKAIHDRSFGQRPTREGMEKAVQEFLVRPQSGDRLVVYFSGHGFRDDEGDLYLAPLDCDPSDPQNTGVPVRWLREQVASSKAETKIVILDACHAGSERSVSAGRRDAGSEDVGEAFRDLDRVVTIASSAASQPSRLDPDHEHSLFTYWLIEGLKGSADSSRDGVVSIDELFGFVHQAVSLRSESLGGRQTPVRIVRPDVDGVPVAVKLVPQKLTTVLDDLALRLSERISARSIGRVGVLEFVDATESGELLGVKYGVLGQWCAESLHERLLRLAGDRFTMIDRRRLKEALARERFTVESLDDAGRMRSLSRSAGGMPAVVIGSLSGGIRLEGRDAGAAVVRIEARLSGTERSDEFERAAGLAYLDESDWAMAGGSAVVKNEDRVSPTQAFYSSRPDAVGPIASTAALVDHLDARAKKGHPLEDNTFPWPVQILVKRGDKLVEQPGKLVNNDWFVALSPGDKYVIQVSNRHSGPVLMRLLVDGLNTRAEPLGSGEKGLTTLLAGKRVHLDAARAWVLDPHAPGNFFEQGFPIWRLHGFEKGHVGKSDDTEFGEFIVVDSSSALAARRGFSDQVGTITAAFYSPKTAATEVATNGGARGGRGGLGTDAGATIVKPVMRVSGFDVGPMLATLTIHYGAGE